MARSFVNLPLLAGCGDAGAWPGNPQGVSTWRRLDANLIRRRGHERVTRVDSSPKVDLLQWRLWFATRSKRDRHFTANFGRFLTVLGRASGKGQTGPQRLWWLAEDDGNIVFVRPVRLSRSAPEPLHLAVHSRSYASLSLCPSACPDCRSSGLGRRSRCPPPLPNAPLPGKDRDWTATLLDPNHPSPYACQAGYRHAVGSRRGSRVPLCHCPASVG
jgi:hypothetical protein